MDTVRGGHESKDAVVTIADQVIRLMVTTMLENLS